MTPLHLALADCPQDHLPAREQKAWLVEGGQPTPWVLQCVLQKTAVLRHPVDNTNTRVVAHRDVLVAAPLRWAPMNLVVAGQRRASKRGRELARRRQRAS